jgi:Zn-dependent oligopeptidase
VSTKRCTEQKYQEQDKCNLYTEQVEAALEKAHAFVQKLIDDEYEETAEWYIEELEAKVASLTQCNKVLKYVTAATISAVIITVLAAATWYLTM